MKKKILFFSHESKLYGAPRSMLLLAEGLMSKFEVSIITHGNGDLVDSAKDLGIPVKVLGLSNLKDTKKNGSFGKIISRIDELVIRIHSVFFLKKINPDIVYINTIGRSWPVIISHFFKYIFVVHVREGSNYIFPDCKKKKKKIESIFSRTINFIAVSESIKSLLEKKVNEIGHENFKINKDNISFKRVYNGIDCNSFQSQNFENIELSIASDKTVVGFLGNLSFRKGIDVFLNAALLVQSKYPNIIFVIIGGNKQDFNSYVHEFKLKDLIGKNLYYHEFVKHPKAAFEIFDIFCMTSRIEPFARVNLEAACTKTPIIATSIDGNEELIDSHESGILIPPGDANALARQIIELSKDKQLQEKISNGAYQKVASCFSVKRYINEIDKYLDKLLMEHKLKE